MARAAFDELQYIPGPRYFTRKGVITFEKREGQEWGAAILPCQAYRDISPGLMV